MTLSSKVLASLDAIDADWALIPVDDRKRPIDPQTGVPMRAWSTVATDLDGIRAMAANRYVKAVGVVLGPQSGGLLAVDFDGPESDATFRAVFGRSAQDLPRTVSWSSGRPARRQLAFYVPLEYWDHLRGRRSWEHDGSTCLELRWIGHQSVIAGAHPDTAGYHWLDGCSPSELDVAECPAWLIDPLFKRPEELPHTTYAPTAADADRAREVLQHIKPRDDYETWLHVGMALHSTDPALLSDWIAWSKGSKHFDEAECHQKWKSFKRTGRNIGSLFYFAERDGWKPLQRATRSQHQVADPEDSFTDQSSDESKVYHLSRAQVLERLSAAYDDGIGLAEMELLIAELADVSDQHPAALRMLLQAIRSEREQLLLIQAERKALENGQTAFSAKSITLEAIFPEELARALRTVSKSLPYVDHAIAMSYLAGLSGLVKLGTSVCGNVLTNFVVPMNLYVATVAKSGQKKTPLEKLAIRTPTREIRLDMARENSRTMENWKQQCRETKKEERPPQPTAMHLHIQDYTGEALTALLCEAEKRRMSILVLRDELAGLFGSMNAYRQGRGSDEQQLLELFDGDSFTSLRISTADRSFSRCHVSIYGGIQPDVLRELIQDGGGDPSGKWARFIFSPLPPITAPLPTTVTPAEIGLLEDADRTLLEYARKVFCLSPVTYNLEPDAVEHFSGYELIKQQQALDAKLASQGALYGKSAGKVLRLAGLIHVVSVAAGIHTLWDPLPLATLKKAIQLVEHLDAWALRFHEVTAGDDRKGLPVSTLMRRIHEIAEQAGKPIGWKQVSTRLTANDRKMASAPLAAIAMDELQGLGVGTVSITARGTALYAATGPLIAPS